MKISVVTVCLNSSRTIAHTIESFLRQDHADKELVVIDGASADDTRGIVASFEDERIRLLSEPDRGLYDAMNKGLRLFSGDAVGFLNSDDRFRDRDALAHIAAGLDAADIVYGNLDFVREHESRQVVRRWRGAPFRKGAFAEGWMPPHPTFYARRRVVETVGFFDLRYRIAADYDYMLRALEPHDFRALLIEHVLVDMARGGKSTSGVGAVLRGNIEALHSRRQWLRTGRMDRAFVAKPLRKLGQFFAS